MKRASPYEHGVGGHYRKGKWVEKYRRGKGEKPNDNPSLSRLRRGGAKTGYNITFSLPSGNTETYRAGGTVTGALKTAIVRIQRPELPNRAVLRRTQT